MPIFHLFLALSVVIIWGLNFLFVKFSLAEMSPLLLCALRFLLASIPAILFISPPAMPFKLVASYGLIMFALQFSLLFLGMDAGMTAGMASLIMQVQVFFSMFFSAIFLKEKPHTWQVCGAAIAFLGIGLVSLHFDSTVSLAGFLYILAAAATWGIGNLITKKANRCNMMALVVWGSFFASIPMVFLALFIEGPTSIIASYHRLSRVGFSALLYTVYASTWIGYGVWNWLLSRYPIGTIVPFTLLVPVVGIISSVIIIGEPFQLWKLAAVLLVISGLIIHLIGGHFFAIKAQAQTS